MVHALLAALEGPVGALATDFLIYVTFGLLLIGLADVVTARAVIPAGSRTGRRGRDGGALFPAIFAGLVAGIVAVHLLPEWFPTAAFAEPLRESALAIGNW
jgi:hypothetical protein